MSDNRDSMQSEVLPLSLRLLRTLVMVLMVVMIAGVITVVWLLVTRMPVPGGSLPPVLPESLALPEGHRALAVTFGTGWLAVVTDQNHILIFDAGGVLRQDVAIQPAP
jgi:hypothetical protein